MWAGSSLPEGLRPDVEHVVAEGAGQRRQLLAGTVKPDIEIPCSIAKVRFGLSLGVTFPLNILVGIPLYTHVAGLVL